MLSILMKARNRTFLAYVAAPEEGLGQEVRLKKSGFYSEDEVTSAAQTHGNALTEASDARQAISAIAQQAMEEAYEASCVVSDADKLKPGQYLILNYRTYIRTHDGRIEDVSVYVNRMERALIALKFRYDSMASESAGTLFKRAFKKLFSRGPK